MMSTSIKVPIALLLCIYLVKAEFKTLFSREESNPNTEDIYGLTSLKNSTLTYKICRNTESINVKKCKIFQENLNSENKETKFCDIALNGEIDEKNVDVVAFGTDKAVVSWFDEAEEKEYYLRYTIVHFSNCTTAEAKISFEKSEDRFLSHAYNLDIIIRKDEHTFDVLFENSTLSGEKVCKVTFDDLGNQVSGPVAWFTALESSFIYVYPNSINGAYVVNEIIPFADLIRISLLKPDGLQILKEFNHSNIDEATEYGSIRVCYVTSENTSINCDLFDSAGQFNSMTSINFNHVIEDVDVYNLHDGGFLTMINSKQNDFDFRFYLMLVDVNGKQFGPMEVPNFECKDMDDKHSHLFENKLGEYCATRACYKGEKYNVLSKCFTVDDLIVKRSNE